MIREVNLVSYLPPFMAEFKEVAAALEAENPEFVLAWEAADRVLRNAFIETADEYGMSRFEKLLGVLPSVDDTLEQRRKTVIANWANKISYTSKFLYAKLVSLCGRDGFTLTIEGYRLEVVIYAGEGTLAEVVEGLLSSAAPANMICSVLYEYPHKGAIYHGGMLCSADVTTFKERR